MSTPIETAGVDPMTARLLRLADAWEGEARETGPLNYRAALDDCARRLRDALTGETS